jgi:hypothetical protein
LEKAEETMIAADWKVFDSGTLVNSFPTNREARRFAITEAELFEVDLLVVQFVHPGQVIPAGPGFTYLVTAEPKREDLEPWKYLDRQAEQCHLAHVSPSRAAKMARPVVNTRRTCLACGKVYEIEEQEIADETYSPLCTECLKLRFEENAITDPRFAERPID